MNMILLHMNATQGGANLHPGAKIHPGANTAHELKVPLIMGLRTLHAMQKIYLTIRAVLYNFLTRPSAMFY